MPSGRGDRAPVRLRVPLQHGATAGVRLLKHTVDLPRPVQVDYTDPLGAAQSRHATIRVDAEGTAAGVSVTGGKAVQQEVIGHGPFGARPSRLVAHRFVGSAPLAAARHESAARVKRTDLIMHRIGGQGVSSCEHTVCV